MRIGPSNLQPSVSVIVLNYNGGSFLVNCIKSIVATDYENFEVIVVDNGSSDGSIEIVEASVSDQRFRVIRNNKNVGYARGNNIGVKSSKGDYVVFLNNDIVVTPFWLKDITKVMEENINIGASQPKLLKYHERTRIDNVGGTIDYCGFPYGEVSGVKDQGQFDSLKEIFVAVGSALIIKRKVLEQIGLFDPDYFAFYDENDLCWRVWLKGYKILLIPTSVVYHIGSASYRKVSAGISARAAFHATKNQLSTLIKNYSLRNLLLYFSTAVLLRVAKIIMHIYNRNNKVAFAEIRGIAWTLRNLKHLYSKRIQVQRSIRQVSDDYLMKYMVRPSFRYLIKTFISRYSGKSSV
jgi:GT2 family glycosyltransferase